ncbi:MAG: type II toxin-antitoxin system RelE/ParE family toxin [archaeon]
MPFNVVWDEKAFEALEKLEPVVSRRVLKKVSELSENPFSKDVKKLKGSEWYRLRVGDYRVVFRIKDDIIQILKVGHRRNIYG